MDNNIARILELIHRPSLAVKALSKHPQDSSNGRKLGGKKVEDRHEAVINLSPLVRDTVKGKGLLD